MVVILREILGSIKGATPLVDGVSLIFFPSLFWGLKPKLIDQPSDHPGYGCTRSLRLFVK
jgi:hypothetical protein